MTLDWDLIRDQLVCIEEDRDVFADVPKTPVWKDQSEETFNQEMLEFNKIERRLLGHLGILLEEDFVAGLTVNRSADGQFYYGSHTPRLKLRGHELLAELRSKVLWERIKSTAKSKGIELTCASIKALGAVALQSLLNN